MRARTEGKSYSGFCLAKHVDPEILRRPLDLSNVEVPAGHEEDDYSFIEASGVPD